MLYVEKVDCTSVGVWIMVASSQPAAPIPASTGRQSRQGTSNSLDSSDFCNTWQRVREKETNEGWIYVL